MEIKRRCPECPKHDGSFDGEAAARTDFNPQNYSDCPTNGPGEIVFPGLVAEIVPGFGEEYTAGTTLKLCPEDVPGALVESLVIENAASQLDMQRSDFAAASSTESGIGLTDLSQEELNAGILGSMSLFSQVLRTVAQTPYTIPLERPAGAG
jgi:hypothetical protein